MKRPKDEDYRGTVTYLYALEKYCDWLEGQPSWKALAEKTRQIKELKEYNELLGESLDAVFPIAAVHGYRESDERIKRGEELRAKLNKH